MINNENSRRTTLEQKESIDNVLNNKQYYVFEEGETEENIIYCKEKDVK